MDFPGCWTKDWLACGYFCGGRRRANNRNYRTIDFVLDSPVRKYLQQESASLWVTEFLFNGPEVGNHLENKCLKLRYVNRWVNVDQRAADVGRNEAEEFLGFRREPANGQVAADNDHGDVDAGEKVHQVVVDLRDLQVAAAKLVVHGGQFFVC